ELRQELRKESRVRGKVGVGPRQVQLDPVAGAEDDRLAAVARAQLVQRAGQLGTVESQPLAHRNGRIAVIAADGQEHHGAPPCTNGRTGAVSVTSNSAKATIVSKATCRPRACPP